MPKVVFNKQSIDMATFKPSKTYEVMCSDYDMFFNSVSDYGLLNILVKQHDKTSYEIILFNNKHYMNLSYLNFYDKYKLNSSNDKAFVYYSRQNRQTLNKFLKTIELILEPFMNRSNDIICNVLIDKNIKKP